MECIFNQLETIFYLFLNFSQFALVVTDIVHQRNFSISPQPELAQFSGIIANMDMQWLIAIKTHEVKSPTEFPKNSGHF